jgi:lipopolysaccharide transport system ATP-binding protein
MINHEQQPYLSLRDKITNIFKPSAPKEEFWALKDVSFDVYPGESIGIIGKNGAGKSTLLKILSKITPPTSGKIISRGRLASLLEVGTGFHPELTGRENVYMNGSIIGMRKKEIQKKFDAIIDFAGVEKFIDTPLKHYSSGMQLRLAFAVAAFLEAEILVIDEVLAVGDAEFQKKCLGKMEEISKQQGRTVLFVSHNMGIISSFCNKVIYLEKGKLNTIGNTQQVINKYIENNQIQIPQIVNSKYYKTIDTKNVNGENSNTFLFSEDIFIYFQIEYPEDVNFIKFGFGIDNSYQQRIFSYYVDLEKKGRYCQLEFKIDKKLLPPGRYSISTALIKHNQFIEILEDACFFEVLENGEFTNISNIPSYYGNIVYVPQKVITYE